MTAKLDCTDLYKESDAELDAATLIDYLNTHNVTYDIKENIIADIVSKAPTTTFPITIAKGQTPENGRDGSFDYCMLMILKLKGMREKIGVLEKL